MGNISSISNKLVPKKNLDRKTKQEIMKHMTNRLPSWYLLNSIFDCTPSGKVREQEPVEMSRPLVMPVTG